MLGGGDAHFSGGYVNRGGKRHKLLNSTMNSHCLRSSLGAATGIVSYHHNRVSIIVSISDFCLGNLYRDSRNDASNGDKYAEDRLVSD